MLYFSFKTSKASSHFVDTRDDIGNNEKSTNWYVLLYAIFSVLIVNQALICFIPLKNIVGMVLNNVFCARTTRTVCVLVHCSNVLLNMQSMYNYLSLICFTYI